MSLLVNCPQAAERLDTLPGLSTFFPGREAPPLGPRRTKRGSHSHGLSRAPRRARKKSSRCHRLQNLRSTSFPRGRCASFFIKRFREPARRRFYADHLDPLHIRTQIENLTSGKNKAFTEKKHTYRYAFSHFSWTVLSVSGFLLSLFSIPLTYW